MKRTSVIVLWVGMLALVVASTPARAAPALRPTDALATSPAAEHDAPTGASPRGRAAPKPRLKYRYPRWIPWVVMGAGLVVAGAGIPILFKSRGDFEKYDREWDAWCHDPQGCAAQDRPQSLVDLERRARGGRIAAITLFGIGGAALITGVVLALANRPRIVRPSSAAFAEPPGFLVTAAPLPGGAALYARLRF